MNINGWTIRHETVKCGKAACQSCPHGPYWYGYKTVAGKKKKKYLGSDKAPNCERIGGGYATGSPSPKTKQPHPHDAIFDQRKRTYALAREILGVGPETSNMGHLRRVHRKLAAKHHPDRGGDAETMKRVKAAYDYLKDVLAADSW